MKKTDVPFNIELLLIDAQHASFMRPVTSLATFVGSSKNFNPDGLFSNETFGIVGTPARYMRRSYINIKAPVFHPAIYAALKQVKSLYIEIIENREFAIWDAKSQDFIKSDMVSGRTGFEFFCEYFQRIEFPNNETTARQQAVELLNKKRKRALLTRVGVMPAGYRDYEIDENDRETSNEINDFYYRMLAVSNTINLSTFEISPESYNTQRVSIQRALNELYDMLSAVVEGKRGLLMERVATRRVMAGTRNVITSMRSNITNLNDPYNVDLNSTHVGLYQFAKSIIFVTIDRVKSGWLSECFSSPNAPAKLVDPRTLQSLPVMLKPSSYTDWLSSEGLEKKITYFEEETTRHLPIKIEGKYLGLVYEHPTDDWFAFIHGIEDLGEGMQAENCRPITMTDLLHKSLYQIAHKYIGLVTRYPITGMGSVFPSKAYLKTTNKSTRKTEYEPMTWSPIEGRIAIEYPVHGADFFNAMAPHPWKLGKMGGDHDGDTSSWTACMSDDALEENMHFFGSRASLIGSDGKFINDPFIDTVNFVLQNLTMNLSDEVKQQFLAGHAKS